MQDSGLACDVSTWGGAGFVNALADVHRAGFSGVEAGGDIVPAFEDRTHVLKEMLEFERLSLITVRAALRPLSGGSAEEECERCLNVARFLHSMSCKLLVLVAPPAAPDSLEEEWLLFTNLLSEAGRRAGELGIRLAVAPERGTIIGARSEVERLAKAFPAKNLPLAVDAAFLAGCGLPVASFLKKYKARLVHLYLSDLAERRALPKGKAKAAKAKAARKKSPLAHVALGRGMVNVEHFLDAATEVGFSGWVTVRLSPAEVQKDSAAAAASAFRVAGEALDLI